MDMTPEISAVVYGESILPESMVFAGGSRDVKYPIVFAIYHIRAGERQILVDAGCDTMPGFEMRNFVSPATALEGIGVKPEQITDVIVTHAHHDHIDGFRHFLGAVVHIQEDEYQAGKRYIPENSRVERFRDSCTVAGLEVIKIGGHSGGSCIVKAGNVVFCGDECYLRACLDRKIPTGASFCPEKSRAFVETYSDPKYRTLLFHDPEVKTGRIV